MNAYEQQFIYIALPIVVSIFVATFVLYNAIKNNKS